MTISTWLPARGAPRCLVTGIVLALLAGVLASSARAQTSSRGTKEDETAAEEAFEKIRRKYDEEKGKPPEERIGRIQEFASAPCAKTVEFLKELYKQEDNVGIHMAVTAALGEIGTEEAVEAIVLVGAPLLVKNTFAASSISSALSSPLKPEAEEWFLKKGMSNRTLREDPAVWKSILQAVAKFKSENRIKPLLKEAYASPTPPPEILKAILEGVEEFKDTSVATVASRLLRSPHPEVQVAAMQCLFNQDADRYRTQFVGGLKSEHWQVRLLSLSILAKTREKKIVDHAVRLLGDRDTRVQVTAVRVLMNKGGKEVLLPLIQHLDRCEGRVKDDVADALARLTGRNFGPVSAQWESWWLQVKDKPGDYVMLSAEEFSRLKEGDKNQQTLLYHGLRVISNNVVFIIDTSESMSELYVPKEERKDDEETRGRTVVAKKPGELRQEPKSTRMEVAKKELHEVVRGLQDGKRFNIIGFDSVILDFIQDALGQPPDHLVKMGAATRPAAQQFTDRTEPRGQTHMRRAIETALGYAEVDTIFLLSDGEPTPESGTMAEILKYVRRENRLRTIKFNTIGFDLKDKERSFLTQLADENFGVFIER